MKKSNHCSKGFSLVEVLVAAAMVALSLVSVVAFVRKGQDEVAIDRHRRMARGIVERTLENPAYDMINYLNLVTKDSLRTNLDTIDWKTTPPLTGNLRVKISDTVTQAVATGSSFPYRKVTVTMSWYEHINSNPDTIRCEKRVTDGYGQ
ncbi:MAG: type II secretion system protein [Chitinispirillaceae bacterium]|jgi:type II secretory pathway pseudopilin PulG